MPICKALLKYGQSGDACAPTFVRCPMSFSGTAYRRHKTSFIIEIIEFCEPDVRFTRETYYLEWLKPKYNIILDATPFSAETATHFFMRSGALRATVVGLAARGDPYNLLRSFLRPCPLPPTVWVEGSQREKLFLRRDACAPDKNKKLALLPPPLGRF